MAAQQEPARRTLTAHENWQNASSWPEDGKWHGEMGMWSTFDISGEVTQVNLRLSTMTGHYVESLQEYVAARQFRNHGGGRITGPINIHSIAQGPGFQQRPQDGHWAREPPPFEFNEQEHSRWDGFAHPFYPQNGPLRVRLLAPSRQRHAGISFALPLLERKQEPGGSLPVWGMMIIMVLPDGSGRRGLKVLYDAETGKFMSAGLENEVFASIDPEQPVDLSTLPPQLQAPAPRLPTDTAGWLSDAASWRGSALRVHIAEAAAAGGSGQLEVEHVDGTPWQHPEVGQGYRLITMPDAMYCLVPEQLPSAAAEVSPDGLHFEAGGWISSDVFSRASLAYSSSGWLQRLTFEDFTS